VTTTIPLMANDRDPARDTVTGAVAETHLPRALAEQLVKAVRQGRRLAVLLAGVDAFRTANERWGRAAGDDVLAAIARRIGAVLPVDGVLARHGGDQLAALCAVTSVEQAVALGERLRTRVSDRPFHVPSANDAFFFTVSVGVVLAPPSARVPPGALLASAEAALRQAKEAGRNRVVVGA
jgi:two-component system cell cycle response regulator